MIKKTKHQADEKGKLVEEKTIDELRKI